MNSNKTKYGVCAGCMVWYPRDLMLAINAKCYDENNLEEKVQIRMCPDCFHKSVENLRQISWDNNLVDGEKMAEMLSNDPTIRVSWHGDEKSAGGQAA